MGTILADDAAKFPWKLLAHLGLAVRGNRWRGTGRELQQDLRTYFISTAAISPRHEGWYLIRLNARLPIISALLKVLIRIEDRKEFDRLPSDRSWQTICPSIGGLRRLLPNNDDATAKFYEFRIVD